MKVEEVGGKRGRRGREAAVVSHLNSSIIMFMYHSHTHQCCAHCGLADVTAPLCV